MFPYHLKKGIETKNSLQTLYLTKYLIMPISQSLKYLSRHFISLAALRTCLWAMIVEIIYPSIFFLFNYGWNICGPQLEIIVQEGQMESESLHKFSRACFTCHGHAFQLARVYYFEKAKYSVGIFVGPTHPVSLLFIIKIYFSSTKNIYPCTFHGYQWL